MEPGRAGAADRPRPPHGADQPVQVFVLVTEETIEENLLATLSAKHELALAALDVDSDLDEVEMVSGWKSSSAGSRFCWAPNWKC